MRRLLPLARAAQGLKRDTRRASPVPSGEVRTARFCHQVDLQQRDFSCETPAFQDLADCLAAADDASAVEGCMAQYEASKLQSVLEI